MRGGARNYLPRKICDRLRLAVAYVNSAKWRNATIDEDRGGSVTRSKTKARRTLVPRALLQMLPPSSLVLSSREGGLIGLPLRVSNEGLPRPRVARAQGTIRLPFSSLPSSLVISQGWSLIDLPLRAAFSPAHPLARRDVPLARARAFQSSSSLVKGVAKAALYCAHRTSTVSPCAFCEQEGHLAAPLPILLRPRVARARKINRLHPLLCKQEGRSGCCLSSPIQRPVM